MHHHAPTNAVRGSRKATSAFSIEGNSGYEPNNLFFHLKSTSVFSGLLAAMSGFVGQRQRRSSREGERLQDPGDQEGRLRVGAADERLQALLEERESRAASVPARTAAVRRLAAAPEQAGQAATTSSARRPSREPESQVMGQQNGPGQVTIESAPGLLDSVRQSLDVLQRAFGGNPQGQGLLHLYFNTMILDTLPVTVLGFLPGMEACLVRHSVQSHLEEGQ